MPRLCLAALLAAAPLWAQQAADAGYSAEIRRNTTEPVFLTELVDHLPSSDRVPSPDKIIGYAVGTPDKLTYSRDIYRYMRALEAASPRVKVFPAGRTEEGREMMLVAISEEANLARLARVKEITARLADPRRTSEAQAAALIAEGIPLYWASGSIHSPETGSPEMLMELAYRLAVEETSFIQTIRRDSVVLITPLIEVDGHDRQVDVYNWRKANPGRTPPGLIYWGRYVAHDNNRDGMALSLELSRSMMRTFLEYHPQVLHDLHESIPFLYISTGMGPYNAWLDPIVTNEWQTLAWHEVRELTSRGVPGVWTHGFFDGWAANYLFYVANGHNSIGRFYETFGGRGADTLERTVPPSQTTRTWYRPNPPLAKVKWSIRNNINLQQSGLLLGMNYVARNKQTFLENFYAKSRRSIEKAVKEGPAAWAIPGDDPRPTECIDLVNLLGLQGVEIHRLTAAVDKPVRLPAGSWIVRMDQPYSRMADMMLDRQYYNPNDTPPYDDTGWSLGPLRRVGTIRITDASILQAAMERARTPVAMPGGVKGQGSGGLVIPPTTENLLATLRFRLKDVPIEVAGAAFKAAGTDFPAGSWLVRQEHREPVSRQVRDLGLTAFAVPSWPQVGSHRLAAPRVALVHTWLNTQTEGWFRLALDGLRIPYSYVSDHVLRDTPRLRDRFDVILFGPASGSAQRIVNGIPMLGQPIPWKKSDLTPNIGSAPDQTDDIRGGMGLKGLMNVERFVQEGGLFVTISGNAAIPIDFGLVEGVSIQATRELRARGSVLSATVADRNSPIVYGYPDRFAVYFNQAPVFRVGFGGGSGPDTSARPSGRGSATDPDIPQGRPYVPPPPKPELKPGEEPPLTEDMREALRAFLPPPDQQPRVILRFAEEKDLLVSGMLAGGRELAGRPALIDVPRGRGHFLLFAINPMWRQQTHGSFFLLFNAMMNFEHLGAGRPSTAGAGTASN